MSRWTHNACYDCYGKKYPKRTPHRLKPEEGQSLPMEACCYCGKETPDGIYVRDDPETTPCKGKGEVHEE